MNPVSTLPSRISLTSLFGLSTSGEGGSCAFGSSGLDCPAPACAAASLVPLLSWLALFFLRLRFLRDVGRTQRSAT